MENKTALKEEFTTLAVLSNRNDQPVRTENESLPFKRPSLFNCSKCEKRFTWGYNLKTHERIHTDDKPFCCSKCKKKFTTSGDIRNHERIHTNEKPFCCSKCDKKF